MGAQWKAKHKDVAANAKGRLFGKLAKGGAVKVNFEDGELTFDIKEAPLAALPKPDGDGEAEKESETTH